jgi:serine/threonine-protein kinase
MPESRSISIRRALDDELIRLESTAGRAMVVLCLAMMALTFVLDLLVDSRMGRLIHPFLGSVVGWYALVPFLMKKGYGVQYLPVIDAMLEASLPTSALVIEHLVLGDRCVGSRVSVATLVMPLLLSILRLRPGLALAVGLVGAAEHSLALFVLIVPRLPAGSVESGAVNPTVLYAQSAVVGIAGVAAALICHVLRRAVGQAHREVRSHDLFGKYRLDKEIAAGGMGQVFRATYCPEGGFVRPVAIKRIHPHLAKEAPFVESFRAEAEVSSRLTHPNIVQVLDFGRIEDTYFLAMEFVEGMTLLELFRRSTAHGTRIPARLVAYIAREMLDGLRFAHDLACAATGERLRVVHRDLSPSNVLLSLTGQVKITDFGVAKVLGQSGVTNTQTVVGKVAYMAPEQALGQPLDTRCDLFSAGVVIWEALCAEPLFKGETQAATLFALLQGPLHLPSSLRSEIVGSRWDPFLTRALERDPGGRFQTAGEMIDVLDAILEAEGSPRPEELARFLAAHPPASAAPTFAASPPAEWGQNTCATTIARPKASTKTSGA